ncbi:MAG: hypothetical protein QW228_06785 [Candidatus Aenigmatarchaeota archaeon]
MYKKVIFRDRQELQADDLNNIEQFTDEAISAIVQDAVSGGKAYFSGLNVSKVSSTEVRIEQGKLYMTDGKIYTLEQPVELNLFTYLPLNFKKIVAIVAYGTEIETNVEPRDFLIDVTTGTTEPNAVAMQKMRAVNINVVPGDEAVHPAKPLIVSGVVPIAWITLSTTGIDLIERAVENELPSINYLHNEIKKLDAWRREFEPKLTGLSSDMAALSKEITTRASLNHVIQLALDMARIKERLEMPDDYKFYGADHFLTLDETDTSPSDYSALVMEGVRPAPSAVTTTSLQVLNPLDPSIRIFDTSLVIPAFREETRLAIQRYVGDVRINAYQYQTTQMVQRTISRTRIRYGEALTVCTNSAFWQSGRYDPITGIFRRNDETWEVDPAYRQNALIYNRPVRLTRFWIDTYLEPYWEAVTVTHTVTGSIIAQTFLSPNTGYLTSVELYFTEVDTSAALTLSITECTAARPDPRKTIAIVNVPANELQTGWCKIQLREPVLLDAGKMYAIVLATPGSHRVGYSQGTEYTQGVLMYSQDAQFLYEDASRDLMMRLNFAKFINPITIVQLQPLSLQGGIHDIDILFEALRPEGTEIYFEYQLGGVWYRISQDTAEQLRTAPPLLPLRVVFTGTTDLQPAFRTQRSQVRVSRYGTTFKHYSTLRTLATPSDHIIVRILLENFDPQSHSISCKLKIGNNVIDATSETTDLVENQNIITQTGMSLWKEYTFQLSQATSSYQIILEGNCGQNPFRVFHVAARYDIAL